MDDVRGKTPCSGPAVRSCPPWPGDKQSLIGANPPGTPIAIGMFEADEVSVLEGDLFS